MDEIQKSGRLLSVNWEDGMLVKAAHLFDQESYFENLNQWIVEHTISFYGLAALSGRQGSSLEMRIEHDGQNWVVVVSKCYALTSGGRIIQVDNRLDSGIRSAAILGKLSDHTPVYIHARSRKLGVGHPAGDNEPSRHPYRAFDYEVVVGDLKTIDPRDCLIIGELRPGDNRPELIPDYIPPCMAIGSHPLLAEQCRRLVGLLTLAQQSAIQGFQAFVTVAQDKPGKFGIEHKWFQDILAALAIQLGGVIKSHPYPELPLAPYSLVAYYQQVFGMVDAMLETYREATLTLRKKYADNEAFKRFLDGIKEFGGTRYNHNDLGKQTSGLIKLMNDFIEFLNLITGLAGALPQRGQVTEYRNREYRLQAYSAVKSQVERDGVTVKLEGLANIASRDILVEINRELFSGVDYRYIMVKIGLNENNIPGRMDPVYVDAETSTGNLILKPMDDLADRSINSINLNFRGNFNPQDLKNIASEMISVYVY